MSNQSQAIFRHGELRELEKLLKPTRKYGIREEEPLTCRDCRYYRPGFRYRFCLFSRCPYCKDVDPYYRRHRKN